MIKLNRVIHYRARNKNQSLFLKIINIGFIFYILISNTSAASDEIQDTGKLDKLYIYNF